MMFSIFMPGYDTESHAEWIGRYVFGDQTILEYAWEIFTKLKISITNFKQVCLVNVSF